MALKICLFCQALAYDAATAIPGQTSLGRFNGLTYAGVQLGSLTAMPARSDACHFVVILLSFYVVAGCYCKKLPRARISNPDFQVEFQVIAVAFCRNDSAAHGQAMLGASVIMSVLGPQRKLIFGGLLRCFPPPQNAYINKARHTPST